jgi:hypothetical protein
VPPTFATCFCGTLAILGEIPRIVPSATATTTTLAALAACLCCAFAIVGKIARAALPTDMAGAGRFLPVLGKIARITGMMLFRPRTSPCATTSLRRRT